ncbi:MAG: M20/M25/M40 family metallo-hydrolase [Deltaproteobacteria bacterium]|nr:M20/M25/M40 family metallo-hydrolase [Deltaproteobacteria bacterium]
MGATTWALLVLAVSGCTEGAVELLDQDCGGTDPDVLRECVDADRYWSLLEEIAVPRPPGSSGWRQVGDRCASGFEAAGFSVERQDYGTGVNIIGRLEGSGDGGMVVVSAHYDHIPDCPGADDNASGVAGVLEAARVLGGAEWERNLVVACWDEEEDGLIGSDAWTDEARENDEEIEAAFVFEMIGYYDDTPGSQDLPPGLGIVFPQLAAVEANDNRGDFIMLVSDYASADHTAAFAAHAAAIGLSEIALELTAFQMETDILAVLRRSDHARFWEEGYPAIMLTDTAEYRNEAYHCRNGDDTVDRLDRDFATAIVSATVGAAAQALGTPDTP